MLVSAPAGEEGGGAGGGGASQVSRGCIQRSVLFSFVTLDPPTFLHCPRPPPRKCSGSVLQDDLDEAGHVGVFGLVGREEGMLLEDGAAEKQRIYQSERALWCWLPGITKAQTGFFFLSFFIYLIHSP